MSVPLKTRLLVIPEHLSPYAQNRVWVRFLQLERERIGSQASFFSYIDQQFSEAITKHRVELEGGRLVTGDQTSLSEVTYRSFLKRRPGTVGAEGAISKRTFFYIAVAIWNSDPDYIERSISVSFSRNVENVIIDTRGDAILLNIFSYLPRIFGLFAIEHSDSLRSIGWGRRFSATEVDEMMDAGIAFHGLSGEVCYVDTLGAIYECEGVVKLYLLNKYAIFDIFLNSKSENSSNFSPVIEDSFLGLDFFESMDFINQSDDGRPQIDSNSYWLATEFQNILSGDLSYTSIYLSQRGQVDQKLGVTRQAGDYAVRIPRRGMSTVRLLRGIEEEHHQYVDNYLKNGKI